MRHFLPLVLLLTVLAGCDAPKPKAVAPTKAEDQTAKKAEDQTAKKAEDQTAKKIIDGVEAERRAAARKEPGPAPDPAPPPPEKRETPKPIRLDPHALQAGQVMQF